MLKHGTLKIILLISTGLTQLLPADVTAESGNYLRRALSLAELQTRARACALTANCDRAVPRLAHITQLDGYVLDPENQDIVLIGRVEPGATALYLDDLVVALRQSAEVYTFVENGTRYLSNPGVSIDPRRDVLRQLNEIAADFQDDNSAAQETQLARWAQVCQLPQDTRVDSIPHDSHAASLMLRVDEDLKRLSSGAEPLPGNLPSLLELYMQESIEGLKAGRTTNTDTMNRFWFTPRQLDVAVDDNAALISSDFGLRLLTEAEYVSAEGDVTGSNAADPIAAKWANLVSENMHGINRPGWRELNALAFTFAVTEVLYDRDGPRQSGLELEWLLRQHQLKSVSTPHTVDGHCRILTEEFHQALDQGVLHTTLIMPSCGGVEFGMPTISTSFAALPIRHDVITSRPSGRTLFWDLQ